MSLAVTQTSMTPPQFAANRRAFHFCIVPSIVKFAAYRIFLNLSKRMEKLMKIHRATYLKDNIQ